MKRYSLLVVLVLLSGCSTHFVHENGQRQSCQAFGYGNVGIAAAVISKAVCKSDARKLGFHEFDIDSGVTGIFLENYEEGQGLKISSVWPNSPASCAGILPGQHISRIGKVPVKNCADAYDLLDNCSEKTVEITIIQPDGRNRTITIEKMNPGMPYRCKGT